MNILIIALFVILVLSCSSTFTTFMSRLGFNLENYSNVRDEINAAYLARFTGRVPEDDAAPLRS
jgi:hypothetical protein